MSIAFRAGRWMLRQATATPRRAALSRYVVVIGTVALLAAVIPHTPIEGPVGGLLLFAYVLACCWFGGPGPAALLPLAILAVSRLQSDDPLRPVESPREVIAFCALTILTTAVGLAGRYQRRLRDSTRIHERLQRQQARALSLARIVFRDLEGRIVNWSEGAAALYGWSAAEASGRPIHELLQTIFPEPLPRIRSTLLRSGQWQGEVKQRARDGRELTVATHWIVYTADDGSPTGVAEVHNDVTELRRAEAEIRDADRRKDLFIATLAHELRNPLAPLRNGLDLLQVTRSASDDEGPILEIMHRQMEHIVRMVDDLLDISRLNTGRVELRRDRVMLADVVRDAVEACRCQLNRAGQELAVSLPQTPVALYADSARLVQIFVNLLSNAGKFTPSGGRISLSAMLDGECVAVHIRDTGAGIPAPALPHIFDTFVQFDKAGSGEGLGLGLSIVRMLVEMHGGRVEAHSAGPGQGSEFIVRLPMTDSLSGARSDAGSGVVPQTGTPTTHRILVVDDNRDAARMLSLMLNKNGFECREAYSGPSALLEAAEFAPDAFLLDLGLPGMNGLELARAIRSIPSFHDTLLIAVSGWDKEEDRRQTREAGFDHHFAKPVAFGELQKLLVNRLQPAGRMPAPIQPVVALPTTATGCCS